MRRLCSDESFGTESNVHVHVSSQEPWMEQSQILDGIVQLTISGITVNLTTREARKLSVMLKHAALISG